MKTLNSIPSSLRYKEDFRRIGDLVNFEGPELTVFEGLDSQSIFVFDWVDSDDQYNRWLVYEVQSKDLLEFIFKKITHCELFEKAAEYDVYFLDITLGKGFSNLPVFQLLEVPKDYWPNDVYFDEADCPDLDKIRKYLHERISKEKLENRIPEVAQYRLQYSFFARVELASNYLHSNIKSDSQKLLIHKNTTSSPLLLQGYFEVGFIAEKKDSRFISHNDNKKWHGFANAC